MGENMLFHKSFFESVQTVGEIKIFVKNIANVMSQNDHQI